ncbi:MAG: MFS transporter [Erysipelotrichaceae bacterium]|nr:MFS transporter [Erysipelotrichaceae bacterium]
MSKLEIKTICLTSLFNIASTLVSSFVSVYLFVYADSLVIMALYTIIRISMFPPFFMIGSKIAKKVPFTITFSIGLCLITCSLVYALTATHLFEINKYYVLIAALITGIGEGFYYFSSNTCIQIVSSAETRARFFSYFGTFGNISNFIAPFIATFIINSAHDDMLGYRRILYLTVCIFIAVVCLAITLHKKSDDKDVKLIECFKLDDEKWRGHQIGVFFYGLHNSLSLILINLIVFKAAGTGGTYSKLQTFFALFTALSYFCVTRKLDRKNINKIFNVGVFLKSSATIVLVLSNNMYGAIYYGIVNALAQAFYDNSYNYLSACAIGRFPDEMTARVVARETVLSISRCIGMGFIILCSKIMSEDVYLKVAVITLSLAPIFVNRVLLKYK